jgi:hypothetical protein
MNSWRKLVLDVLNGVDKDTDESVRESIQRCRCEPPAETSGTLGETLRFMAIDEAKKKTPNYKIPVSRDLDQANQSYRKTKTELIDKVMRLTRNSTDRVIYEKAAEAVEKAWSYYFDDEIVPMDDKKAIKDAESKYIAAVAKFLKIAKKTSSAYDEIKNEKNKEFKSPCSKIFEKLVFGYKKGRGFSQDHEENTVKEGDIEYSVTSWITAADYSKGDLKNFEILKSCVGSYPDEFKPTVSEIWRGLGVSVNNNLNKKWLPMASFMRSKDILKIGKTTYVGASIDYKQGKELESWAAEPAVADRFARENSGFDPYFRRGYFMKEIPRLDKSLAKQEKLKKEKRTDEYEYSDLKSENSWDLESIIENLNEAHFEITSSSVPVVITGKTDKNCLFSEWFANALSLQKGLGKESEVLRVVSDKDNSMKAKIYIQKSFIDVIKQHQEMVEMLESVIEGRVGKHPKIKKFEFE